MVQDSQVVRASLLNITYVNIAKLTRCFEASFCCTLRDLQILLFYLLFIIYIFVIIRDDLCYA